MKIRILMLLCAVLTVGAVTASAGVLNTGNAQVDDSLNAYISTNNSSLGTPFLSCGLGVNVCTGGSVTLTPGQNYFIQVVVDNDCCAGGFGAIFTLSGGGFTFLNGGTYIDTTYTSDWLASAAMNNGDPWQTPTYSSVLESGTPYPAIPGMIWSTAPNAAGYLYDNPGVWNGQCEYCQIDFSTEIVAPEPSSLMLLGFGVPLLFRRRAAMMGK